MPAGRVERAQEVYVALLGGGKVEVCRNPFYNRHADLRRQPGVDTGKKCKNHFLPWAWRFARDNETICPWCMVRYLRIMRKYHMRANSEAEIALFRQHALDAILQQQLVFNNDEPRIEG